MQVSAEKAASVLCGLCAQGDGALFSRLTADSHPQSVFWYFTLFIHHKIKHQAQEVNQACVQQTAFSQAHGPPNWPAYQRSIKALIVSSRALEMHIPRY